MMKLQNGGVSTQQRAAGLLQLSQHLNIQTNFLFSSEKVFIWTFPKWGLSSRIATVSGCKPESNF